MKILFASSPLAGHVNPTLAAAQIMQKAGHTVALYSGTQFREKISAGDILFFPLPRDVDYDAARIAEILAPFGTGPEQGVRGVKALFVDALTSQFRGLELVLQSFSPDLIVYETAFLGILPLLLGSLPHRPACAYLGIGPVLLPREDGAPFGLGLPPAMDDATREQYKEIAATVYEAASRPLREFTDQYLLKLGATSLPAPLFESATLLADIILQPTVPGFEYPLRETPKTLHFIGVLRPELAGNVPSELLHAKMEGRRIVLVSQGTIANTDLGLLAAPTIKALKDRDDILTVVTTGGRPLSEIPCSLPVNAMAFEFLNFDTVLPVVDVLVAFGGYGTVNQALSFGVPMVLAGKGEDKPENAARVVWTGAGLSFSTDAPEPGQIRMAVDAILSQESYRIRAKALAAEFSSIDTPNEVRRLLSLPLREP
jgi:UDP:flavonoid glycosyltransferase YjiC (YdhE family)